MAKFKHEYSPPTTDVTISLLDQMAQDGCEPADSSDVLNPPVGDIIRFMVKGDKSGSKNGWIQAGDYVHVYGNWKLSSGGFHWSAEGGSKPLSEAEKASIARVVAQSKIKRKQLQTDATEKAKKIIAESEPANDDHPYLVKKRVSGEGLRCQGSILIVPMQNSDDNVTGLQRIFPDGEKRFPTDTPIKGNYWICGAKVCGQDYAGPIFIGEGVATMAAIRRATGACVVAAMFAHNIPSVAEAIRFRFPNNEIVICGDHDKAGYEAVENATELVESKWAFPFDEKFNDFADLPDDQAIVSSLYPFVKHHLDKFNQKPDIKTMFEISKCFVKALADGDVSTGVFIPLFAETVIGAGIDPDEFADCFSTVMGMNSKIDNDGFKVIPVSTAPMFVVKASDLEWMDDHEEESIEDLEVPTSEKFDTAGMTRLWWRDELDGMLALLVKAIMDQCHRDQPELALAAAIPIVGALAGRRYQWSDGLMTNIYSIGIARTASGKDTGLQVANQVWEVEGCESRLMGSHLASGQGLITALHENPTKFMGIDEYGKFVERTSGKKASQNDAMINKILLELTSGKNFNGTNYANDKERPRQAIAKPALSVMGVTTPSTLFKALNSGASLEGSLNRHLFFFGPDKNPPQRLPIESELPATVATYAGRINNGAEDHDTFPIPENSVTAPKPYTVPVTDDAMDLLNTMFREQDELTNHDDEMIAAAFGRATELSKRLALIKAVSRCPERPVIEESDLLWSGRIAFTSCQTIASKCRDHVAENEYHEKLQRLLGVIKGYGRKGVKLETLTGKSRWLDARERHSILESLTGEGAIKSDANPTAGRTATRYVYAKALKAA